jgi:hypothetical protein
MGSQKRSNSDSAEECREFLVAVVNSRPGLLRRFEGWIPRHIPQDGEEYAILLSLYRRLAPLWVHPKVPLNEAPKNVTDLYVLLLHHKLRVVWERALGHQNPGAAVRRLWAETREIDHAYGSIKHHRWANELLRLHVQPTKSETYEEFALRLDRIERAMQWLQKNTHKLMKCAKPDCTRNLYCIREKPHQKYCTPFCAALAERIRVSQRPTKKPRGDSRLSPDGRARIVAGQKKRWDEYRKRKMKSPSSPW